MGKRRLLNRLIGFFTFSGSSTKRFAFLKIDNLTNVQYKSISDGFSPCPACHFDMRPEHTENIAKSSTCHCFGTRHANTRRHRIHPYFPQPGYSYHVIAFMPTFKKRFCLSIPKHNFFVSWISFQIWEEQLLKIINYLKAYKSRRRDSKKCKTNSRCFV